MAEQLTEGILRKPLMRLGQVLKLEKKEIGAIYIYAILAGLLNLSVPLGIQAIINFVLAGALSTSMVVLILLVVTGVFCTGWLQINQMKIIEKVQQRIFTRYSFEFAWRIPKLDMQKVDSLYLPEMVNRFFDTIVLQKSLSRLLLDIPTATIQVVFGLTLLSLYANIFIVFSLIVLLVLFLIIRLSGPRGLQTSLQESEYKYNVASWLEEIARVLKSFRFSKGSSLPIDKTDELVGKYLNSRTSHFKILMLQYWTLVGFKVMITAGMLVVGSILLVRNEINVGQFVAAEIVILTVLSSIEKLIQSLDKVYDILTAVEKLGKVMDKPLENEGTLQLEPVGDGLNISIQNVNFGYIQERPILQQLNLEISKREKICITGTDGSGKSTLIKLLTGSYHHFEGSININGVPIGNYDVDSVRAATGILFHQQDIFNGTLYENITLGDNSITTSQIAALAEEIGLQNFIQTLKKGFDTVLDPTGKRLPGGVVRKILLLRALIHKPRLLLLEEPWLGFDEEAKQKIQQYLLQKIPSTTVLIITNDTVFAEQCTRTVKMENGTIV